MISNQTNEDAYQVARRLMVGTKWLPWLYNWNRNILDPSREKSASFALNLPLAHVM